MKRDKDPIFLAFGQALRLFRHAAKLSQEDLAMEASIDRTFVSRLEAGTTQPTLRTILSLAVALHIPPDDLIKKTADLLSRRQGQRAK